MAKKNDLTAAERDEIYEKARLISLNLTAELLRFIESLINQNTLPQKEDLKARALYEKAVVSGKAMEKALKLLE
jgi:hypothetical protein